MSNHSNVKEEEDDRMTMSTDGSPPRTLMGFSPLKPVTFPTEPTPSDRAPSERTSEPAPSGSLHDLTTMSHHSNIKKEEEDDQVTDSTDGSPPRTLVGFGPLKPVTFPTEPTPSDRAPSERAPSARAPSERAQSEGMLTRSLSPLSTLTPSPSPPPASVQTPKGKRSKKATSTGGDEASDESTGDTASLPRPGSSKRKRRARQSQQDNVSDDDVPGHNPNGKGSRSNQNKSWRNHHAARNRLKGQQQTPIQIEWTVYGYKSDADAEQNDSEDDENAVIYILDGDADAEQNDSKNDEKAVIHMLESQFSFIPRTWMKRVQDGNDPTKGLLAVHIANWKEYTEQVPEFEELRVRCAEGQTAEVSNDGVNWIPITTATNRKYPTVATLAAPVARTVVGKCHTDGTIYNNRFGTFYQATARALKKINVRDSRAAVAEGREEALSREVATESHHRQDDDGLAESVQRDVV
ncbi:hypothetical protein TREMEDRAFT_65736 [Tremella mesenterica DSM 1558]|uniref:uncharacterized protein n=1 Tax=Tremella mesenterica (strain ATCC 24925 / CBS 8224 / DSM 1558 / NBRC 9311 / NRRL Y-6157 / RJB 2259-6 / UBC 559-6) TaxID=578456 RepID=UPI00032B9A0C|nr:uncharacterized protein TREMEDRAFT_65736 [Tremella mesenterica DSM 1558]EIW66142.1 hypothetical protein TREMEDRAFT_65736 [Tremella mesenterica DSM 1558]